MFFAGGILVSRAEQKPLKFGLWTAIGLCATQLLRTKPVLQDADHSYSRGVRQTVWHMFRNQSGEMISKAVSHQGWASPASFLPQRCPAPPPPLHSCQQMIDADWVQASC